MATPDQDHDAASKGESRAVVELFVRKRMFSLYVSGREILLNEREFAVFLNLVVRRGEFISYEWLADAVYGILHKDDTAPRLRQDVERLKEQLSLAVGYTAILEDQRGYALSDAVAVKVRAL